MSIKIKFYSYTFLIILGLLIIGQTGCGSSSNGNSNTNTATIPQAMALLLASINSTTVVGSDCPNGGNYTTSEGNVTFHSCAFENYSISGSGTASSTPNTFNFDLTVNSTLVGTFTVTGTESISEGQGGSNSFDNTGSFGTINANITGTAIGGAEQSTVQSANFKVVSNNSTILTCTINSSTNVYNITCANMAAFCNVSVTEACQ